MTSFPWSAGFAHCLSPSRSMAKTSLRVTGRNRVNAQIGRRKIPTPGLPRSRGEGSHADDAIVTYASPVSLENSRKMKEKSHRVSRRCYRSGVEAVLCTVERRLDGYRLYTSGDVQVRPEKQARRRRVRPAARQLRRWGDPAQRDRHPARVDQASGGVSRGRPPAGQDSASDARIAPATPLWPRLRLRRLQR